MPTSLEFILGLLDTSVPAFVTAEDFAGAHAHALRLWQRLGLLANVPEPHPVPGCPYCLEGSLILLVGRCLCSECQSTVDPSHGLRWRFDLGAFLTWLTAALALEGTPRHVDDSLWQLGTQRTGGLPTEYFLCRSGPLSERGRQRLRAFRSAFVLRFLPEGDEINELAGRCLSLLEILRHEGQLLIALDPQQVLKSSARVQFDPETGTLRVGETVFGEVPPGSKEYHFLATLAERLDTYVPYADLKHEVLRRSGSMDTTEEATFCQKLKSRMKRVIPGIDALLVTTGKGDGYRLRASVER